MNPERTKLATSLHFVMDMDRDHAGCPFSDEQSAADALTNLQQSEKNWSTFVSLMAEVGDPVPDDFHWNDHMEHIA